MIPERPDPEEIIAPPDSLVRRGDEIPEVGFAVATPGDQCRSFWQKPGILPQRTSSWEWLGGNGAWSI
jgi:hypothetical protein